jgi:hypothetical protein
MILEADIKLMDTSNPAAEWIAWLWLILSAIKYPYYHTSKPTIAFASYSKPSNVQHKRPPVLGRIHRPSIWGQRKEQQQATATKWYNDGKYLDVLASRRQLRDNKSKNRELPFAGRVHNESLLAISNFRLRITVDERIHSNLERKSRNFLQARPH